MDFRRLDLNLLLVLDALFEEHTTVGVARRLRISQPTVSAALGKLRRFFKDDLFVRTGAGMHPTPFAETLRAPVRRIVDMVRLEVFRESGFDPSTSERCFAFSTSDIGEMVFLPRLLEAAAEAAPGVTFQTVVLAPAKLRTAMASGSVDLALGYFPDLAGPGFYEQRLFDHPFTCVVRRDHPSVTGELTLEQFLGLDHLVVVQEGRSQEIFEKRMADLGLSRRVALRSPHFMSVPFVIAGTDMIATVPYAVGRAYADFEQCKLVRPPIDIPAIVLKQLWHQRVHHDAGARWLRQLVAKLFLNNDPTAPGWAPGHPVSLRFADGTAMPM